MAIQSPDQDHVAKREARDERQVKDRSDDPVPARVVGERYDADQLDEDADLLPRRVVGEQLIDRAARQETAGFGKRSGPLESDVYNLDSESRRADPYGEDLGGIPALEQEPEFRDIQPDQIQSEAPGAVGDDDVPLSVRTKQALRPISPDELPEG